MELGTGDVALLPLGSGHALASHPTRPVPTWDRLVATLPVQSDPQPVHVDGEGSQSKVICGRYPYDLALAHPLLRNLPAVIHLTADEVARSPRLDGTLRLLEREVADPTPGARTVIDHLVAVLFIQVLRAWGDAPDSDAPWLRAIRDPDVAKTLEAIHERPADDWTVASLAAHVGVSRATLARRFTRLVGESPLAYLTGWRMDLAASRLRGSDEAVHRISAEVGYRSESAFSRAFSRARGTSPTQYRAQHREGS